MKKRELYTAVGRFIKNTTSNAGAYPTVSLGGKEYHLDHQELLLWSVLNWRIVHREEIAEYYRNAMHNLPVNENRSLDACINRLLTRGLLICGSGETEYDALYDLLASMYIVPVGKSFFPRLAAGMKLIFCQRVHPRILKKLLRRDIRTNDEQAVMALSHQMLLSSAEIIRCMEKGIEKLESEDSVVEALYADRDTTSDNIASVVKKAHCSQSVITSIANLYLRQQVIFDRV